MRLNGSLERNIANVLIMNHVNSRRVGRLRWGDSQRGNGTKDGGWEEDLDREIC